MTFSDSTDIQRHARPQMQTC